MQTRSEKRIATIKAKLIELIRQSMPNGILTMNIPVAYRTHLRTLEQAGEIEYRELPGGFQRWFLTSNKVNQIVRDA